MAFEVKFGKSDKRINSTKIPTFSESALCVLKSGTSVENPTFILQGVAPFDWNLHMKFLVLAIIWLVTKVRF